MILTVRIRKRYYMIGLSKGYFEEEFLLDHVKGGNEKFLLDFYGTARLRGGYIINSGRPKEVQVDLVSEGDQNTNVVFFRLYLLLLISIMLMIILKWFRLVYSFSVFVQW